MTYHFDRCVGCTHITHRTVGDKFEEGTVDLLIVGEAPGVEEIKQGTPFVGPSGRFLIDAIKQVPELVKRNPKILVTNAVLCRHKEEIRKETVRACRSRLMELIDRVKPKVILSLGNTALHSLTDKFTRKITSSQGKPIFEEGYVVLPTFHPAAILRTPTLYHLSFYQLLRRFHSIWITPMA